MSGRGESGKRPRERSRGAERSFLQIPRGFTHTNALRRAAESHSSDCEHQLTLCTDTYLSIFFIFPLNSQPSLIRPTGFGLSALVFLRLFQFIANSNSLSLPRRLRRRSHQIDSHSLGHSLRHRIRKVKRRQIFQKIYRSFRELIGARLCRRRRSIYRLLHAFNCCPNATFRSII